MRTRFAAAVLSSVLALVGLMSIAPAKGACSSTAQDDKQAGHVVQLTGPWREIMLKVGRASVVSNPSLHSAMAYWESGFLWGGSWSFRSDGDSKTPQSLRSDEPHCTSVLIDGDCLADLTVEGRALILIRGNLVAKIAVGRFSEIIIGGSILEGGSIEASGIAGTFVGGDMLGSMGGGQTLWIEGSMKGVLRFSEPLRADVGRDFTGRIEGTGAMASLSLNVSGFMPQATLVEAGRGSLAKASVGLSDVESGLYTGKRSSWWVVHQKASPDYIKQITMHQ